jgi:Ca2+-binding RTX toxin-like protein
LARIIDGNGDSYRVGTLEDDFMPGRGGQDELYGIDGDDRLWGGLDNDQLSGGPGDDFADGGPGCDRITGEEGFDILRGRSGDDGLDAGYDGGWLRGDNGNDVLSAWDGPYARLEGGTGDDLCLTGCEREPQFFDVITGRGEDTVYFSATADGQLGQTHVRDFAPGADKLDLALYLNVTEERPETATLLTSELFRRLDGNGDRVLDGTDPASGFASSFVLGSGEHGIGIWVGDDALVVQLPEDVAALTVNDFLL